MTEDDKLFIEDKFREASREEWVEMSERLGDVATTREDSQPLTDDLNQNGIQFDAAYCTRRKRPA